MAPRGKRAKATEGTSPASGLLGALRFIGVAQNDKGMTYQKFSLLSNGYAIGFDGVTAAGCPIAEDLNACPQTSKLVDALERCGDSLSITQLDLGRISIKSDKFKAFVPCVSPIDLQQVAPDLPCAAINDGIKEALINVSCLVSDSADTVLASSILLQANSAISTNRHVILESWHGVDLPPGLVLPKLGAMAVAKNAKPLASLGFSPRSVTFWFNDNSWIKTQLYLEEYPNVNRILNVPIDYKPIPEGFFMALDAVEKFSENGFVYYRNNALCSHDSDGAGAIFELEGLPDNLTLHCKYLRFAQEYMDKVDFSQETIYFMGDKVRGAMVRAKA